MLAVWLVYSFRQVSRVVRGTHFRIFVFGRQAAIFVVNWWRVKGSTAREPLHWTHPLTPSTRLDGPQSAIFQVFGMTRLRFEHSLPAFVAMVLDILHRFSNSAQDQIQAEVTQHLNFLCLWLRLGVCTIWATRPICSKRQYLPLKNWDEIFSACHRANWKRKDIWWDVVERCRVDLDHHNPIQEWTK